MRKTKWFWSYKIEATEKWLEKMAQDGYELVSINRLLRQFQFQETTPQKKTYSIDYKNDEHQRFKQADWDVTVHSGNWTIFSAMEAKIYPTRERVLKRLTWHMYAMLLIIISLLPILIIPSTVLITFSGMGKVQTIPILFILMALVYSAIGWAFMKFRKQEKILLGLVNTDHTGEKYVRKIRLAWFYEPYRTKLWLQQMFDEGYELERASSILFYFKKRTSEAISYEVLYENKVNANYYSFHQEVGWRLCYTSSTSFMNSTIWAMPYEKGEEPPKITYNVDERKSIMRKNLAMTTVIFVLISMPVLFMFMSEVFIMKQAFFTKDFLGGIRGVNVVLIICWLFIYARSIRGYRQEIHEMKRA